MFTCEGAPPGLRREAPEARRPRSSIRWSVDPNRRRLGARDEGTAWLDAGMTLRRRLCDLLWTRRSPADDSSAGGGGDEETRTPDPLLAKEMLCQLSYVPGGRVMLLVGVSGLEPETSALSGQCSNQLS